MPTDWNKIAEEAVNATDEKFKNQISSLTRFNDDEIEDLIMSSGISKVDLVAVLKEVKDTNKSNEQKAKAIKNITGGVNLLVGIALKLV
jgi:hypothetical protein